MTEAMKFYSAWREGVIKHKGAMFQSTAENQVETWHRAPRVLFNDEKNGRRAIAREHVFKEMKNSNRASNIKEYLTPTTAYQANYDLIDWGAK